MPRELVCRILFLTFLLSSPTVHGEESGVGENNTHFVVCDNCREENAEKLALSESQNQNSDENMEVWIFDTQKHNVWAFSVSKATRTLTRVGNPVKAWEALEAYEQISKKIEETSMKVH